jgi:hypothetical protein
MGTEGVVGQVPKLSQRGARTLLVVLSAVLAAGVVLGGAGRYLFGKSEPTPWNKPATVDGSLVQLTYIGSECQDGANAEVEEDPARVVVTVHETVRANSCSDVGVMYEIDVRLDAPLGDRELVDGACQMSEYASRSECAPQVDGGGPSVLSDCSNADRHCSTDSSTRGRITEVYFLAFSLSGPQ